MELTHTAQRRGRLSGFLKEELSMSAGLINRLKWADKLRVNGISCRTDYPVEPGDVITCILEEPAPNYPPEPGPLTILYEDSHLLAVDKPQGMLIHPSRSRLTGTLANRVLAYYQATGQSSAFHPLTRLDRDTFGIVLLAKNAHIHSLLQQQKVEKTYHALVLGGPDTDSGTIQAPIARMPLPSLLRCIHPEGKAATTLYRVLERRGSRCKLALTPVTGRTHQLRLHCAHMGFPILGDPQYGREESLALAQGGQQLCAYSLTLTHPITGQVLELRSGLDVTL